MTGIGCSLWMLQACFQHVSWVQLPRFAGGSWYGDFAGVAEYLWCTTACVFVLVKQKQHAALLLLVLVLHVPACTSYTGTHSAQPPCVGHSVCVLQLWGLELFSYQPEGYLEMRPRPVQQSTSHGASSIKQQQLHARTTQSYALNSKASTTTNMTGMHSRPCQAGVRKQLPIGAHLTVRACTLQK